MNYWNTQVERPGRKASLGPVYPEIYSFFPCVARREVEGGNEPYKLQVLGSWVSQRAEERK